MRDARAIVNTDALDSRTRQRAPHQAEISGAAATC
jgi:hypothetical protein